MVENIVGRQALSLILGVCLISGCQQAPVIQHTEILPSAIPELQSPTPLVHIETEPTSTTEIPTEVATNTPIPSPTARPTETPIPDGFGLVPDLRGMLLADARTAVMDAGFSFLFQDVLNPEVPTGTIIDQDPPAGIALPLNEVVFLYRSFQGLEMYAGGACQPLRIILPAGKLLYWVELDEGISYNVRTDFAHGRTQVSDYRMYLLAEFENAVRDSIDVTPLAPGRYVISLGPYEVSKSDLEREGSISAGCLWITPEDLDQ